MERSGAAHAFGSRLIALGTVVLLGTATADARAADSSPGAPALRQARAAWDRGALEAAEPLYRVALERGGLAPAEVLEGYVRLGSIRAVLKKSESAGAAFKAASIIDEKFTIPTEAGARGANLAERAKRDTAKIGSIQLGIQVPKEATAGKSFKVTATLDKAHMPIVNRIGLTAKDGTTGKEVTLDAKPDESVEFEIASDVTLPGASILVHIDALDAHLNRLASAEERVKVPDAAPAPIVTARPTTKEKPRDKEPAKKSFFSTPWPYVAGGIALLGIAAAIFFGTRPAQNVQVGAPAVNGQ